MDYRKVLEQLKEVRTEICAEIIKLKNTNLKELLKTELSDFYQSCLHSILYDESKCFCEELYVSAAVTRLCSLFPFYWTHNPKQQNVCEFYPSKLWILYSFSQQINYVISIHYVMSRDFNNQPFLLNLVSILELTSPSVMIVMSLCFILSTKSFAKCMTIIAYYRTSGLICYKSIRFVGGLAKTCFAIMIISISIQLLIWVYFNKRIWPPEDLGYLATKYACGMIPVIFAYYSVLLGACAAVANCIRSIIMKLLKAKSIHPILSLDQVFTRYNFFGLYKFTLCSGLAKHQDFNVGTMQNVSSVEKWDFINYIIDELVTTFKLLSNALTPGIHIIFLTFLVQIILTLYILVIVWNYDATEIDNFWRYFFSNIFSILTELIFVTLFLRAGTFIQAEFNSIQDSLLQYSTCVTDDFEQLQLRLLIDKFKYEKNLRGDGTEMYTMEMFQMIIPTIITYFLVALQYRPY